MGLTIHVMSLDGKDFTDEEIDEMNARAQADFLQNVLGIDLEAEARKAEEARLEAENQKRIAEEDRQNRWNAAYGKFKEMLNRPSDVKPGSMVAFDGFCFTVPEDHVFPKSKEV